MMLTALKRPSSLFSSIFPTVFCSSFAIFFYFRTSRPRWEMRTRSTLHRSTDTVNSDSKFSDTLHVDCQALWWWWRRRWRWWSLSSPLNGNRELVVGAPRALVAGSTTRLKLLGRFITTRASNRLWTGNGSTCPYSPFSRTLTRW